MRPLNKNEDKKIKITGDENANVKMCGVTRLDRIRNKYKRGSLKTG